MNELHKFKQEMGYKGKVGKAGDVKRIVKAATGQDKLIPAMFIFGPRLEPTPSTPLADTITIPSMFGRLVHPFLL